MSFTLHELPRAKADKRSIVQWIYERSPAGASAWLDAYDGAIEQLGKRATAFTEAYEITELKLDVRQILFRTRRGRVYRALFIIEDTTVYVLRVRGPGQAPVLPHDLEIE